MPAWAYFDESFIPTVTVYLEHNPTAENSAVEKRVGKNGKAGGAS
jgi:hypothetical protein